MTRDIDVLVVGDANPDLILRGDVVPRFGQSEQLLDSADLTVGGSGAIVAHGLARLGLRTMLVAVIGADTFGSLTRQQLVDAGIDTAQMRTDPERPTGLSVILTHGDSRSTLTLTGAIASLDPAGIDDELLARVRHVHAASFFLQPRLAAGLADLFSRAREAGASTSLDTNLDPAGRWDGLESVLPLTDVLLPNRTEILALARRYGGVLNGAPGRPGADRQATSGQGTGVGTTAAPIAEGTGPTGAEPAGGEAAGTDLRRAESAGTDVATAAEVIAVHGPLVVVKDGERGAVAVGPPRNGFRATLVRQAGHPVAAVDSTGAGDSFDAGYLAGYLQGLGPEECLRMACRAGALSTLGIGGTTSQATLEQILA